MSEKVREFSKATPVIDSEMISLLEMILAKAKAGKVLGYSLVGISNSDEVFFSRHTSHAKCSKLKLIGGMEMEKSQLLMGLEIL